MKELKFFAKEISLGGIEDRIEKIKWQVERVQNDPLYGTGFGSDNLEFCELFTWCKYDQYNHPQEGSPGGVASREQSVKSDLVIEYKNWLKNEFINFEFNKRLAKDLIYSIIRLKRKCAKEEYLKLTINKLLDDYCSQLVELHPSFFNSAVFLIPVQNNGTLNDDAFDDLVSIYRLSFRGKTICSSISGEEWVAFFIGGKLPKNPIRLNFSTSISSLAFEYLAEKYCDSSKKDFYLFIQNSQIVYTARNSLLKERNISKSVDTYNDSTKAFRAALKTL